VSGVSLHPLEGEGVSQGSRGNGLPQV